MSFGVMSGSNSNLRIRDLFHLPINRSACWLIGIAEFVRRYTHAVHRMGMHVVFRSRPTFKQGRHG